MQVCPNCTHRNRPGVIFCEQCGASLIGDAPISTRSLVGPKGATDGSAPEIAFTNLTANASTEIFPKGGVLKIEITGAEPLLLKTKQEIIFGRRDPATGAMPDVDLTPFAGYRMGVSRRHAAIRQSEEESKLELWDLGSSNGTYVNGMRLQPHRPQRLRDGDEVRFGQMTMKLYFQVLAVPGSKPAETAETLPHKPPEEPAPAQPEPPLAQTGQLPPQEKPQEPANQPVPKPGEPMIGENKTGKLE